MWLQGGNNTEVPCLAAYLLEAVSHNKVDVKVCFSVTYLLNPCLRPVFEVASVNWSRGWAPICPATPVTGPCLLHAAVHSLCLPLAPPLQYGAGQHATRAGAQHGIRGTWPFRLPRPLPLALVIAWQTTAKREAEMWFMTPLNYDH